jgi:hypothetical protein
LLHQTNDQGHAGGPTFPIEARVAPLNRIAPDNGAAPGGFPYRTDRIFSTRLSTNHFQSARAFGWFGIAAD